MTRLLATGRVQVCALRVCMQLALLLVGCGDDTDADACTAGDSEACSCASGASGMHLCLRDGTMSDCRCVGESPTTCGPPGRVLSCACQDAAGTGTQVCLDTGELSRCRCPNTQDHGQGDGRREDMSDPSEAPRSSDTNGVQSAAPDAGKPDAPTPSTRCCHDLGACLPRTLVPSAEAERLTADDCAAPDEQLCVPDQLANPAGFSLQPCRSLAHAEGRCAPECLSGVADLAEVMPQDLCPDHHLCVPCFDPFTGDSTGICNLSNDSGPRERGIEFGSCCEERGACVPSQLVPASERELLATDDCDPALDLVCVPEPLGDPEGFVLESCRATGDFEGRCAPTCLPNVAALADQLDQSTCADDERCVPCFEPVSGTPTGICQLSNDAGPQEAPGLLPRCCDQGAGPEGVCLPANLLPPELESRLPQETCPLPSLKCAPLAQALDQAATFPPCSDGACVPECIIESPLAGILEQQECDFGSLCVPCTVLGEPTGACGQL